MTLHDEQKGGPENAHTDTHTHRHTHTQTHTDIDASVFLPTTPNRPPKCAIIHPHHTHTRMHAHAHTPRT